MDHDQNPAIAAALAAALRETRVLDGRFGFEPERDRKPVPADAKARGDQEKKVAKPK